MDHQTSEQEVMTLPGSVPERKSEELAKSDDAVTVIERLQSDLRELLEASEAGKAGRLMRARQRARNTLQWLEY